MMQTKQFWTRIYEKNIGKMVGVCYRYVGDRAVAEDLAHEAFLKAIEKSDSYRRLGGFENWLMRINLNTTLDYLRRQPQFVSFSEDDVVETRLIASPPNDTISVDTVETQIFASPQTEIEKDPEQQVKGTESSVSPLPEILDTNMSVPPSSRHSLKKIERNGFFGLADEHDHVVVYPKYSDIQPFDIYREGWAMVSVFGFEGFIDTTGREVVAPKYESIAPFNAHRPGLARVRIGKFYGYIDTNGIEIIPIGQ